MTSQARKKIMERKKTNPRQDGRLSVVRYIMKTHPSWEAASYTVKKLVAGEKERTKLVERQMKISANVFAFTRPQEK